MIKYKSVITQIIYVLFGCAAIWSMIDSPLYSANDRMTGYVVVDAIVIVWSLYMFISGFIVLTKSAYGKTQSDQETNVRIFSMMRMILAALFGIGTQWFFFWAVLEYMN